MGTIEGGPLGQPGPGSNPAAPDAAAVVITPDAGSGSGAFTCRNPVPQAQLSSGNHNPGQDCNGACHNHGFTLAGTLTIGANSLTPVLGATITVTDAAGKTIDMVSQRNGNFYTSAPVQYPVKVIASSCPTIVPMGGSIAQGTGGCNQAGCHVPGAQGYVHLP